MRLLIALCLGTPLYLGSSAALAGTNDEVLKCNSIGSCKQARVCSTRPECARAATFKRFYFD